MNFEPWIPYCEMGLLDPALHFFKGAGVVDILRANILSLSLGTALA